MNHKSMQNKKKHILLLLSALCLFLWTFASAIFAADTKINKVSITITDAGRLESGEEVGEPSAEADSEEYYIDNVSFVSDSDVWQSGETPQVCVELYANRGYRFSYTSKSHFSVSGYSASFDRAKITDGGDGLKVYINLKKVSGKPLEVENLYWQRNEARWDKMSDASKYEVRLYRGSSIVTTQTATKNRYDFTSQMTQKGRYRFRVRSISKFDVTGNWSDYSEILEVDEDDAKYNATHSNTSSTPDSGSSTTSPGNSGGTPGNPSTPSGNTGNSGTSPIGTGWINDPQNGWWYRNADGSYPKNTWFQINGKYYYFDNSGYMKTGWISSDNRWYFAASDGARTTGWQYINNKWYYLDGSGAMLTGWQYINNKWYYLDGSGAMLTGWQNINNRRYFLDNSGAMVMGWQNISGQYYYFDATGALVTNTTTPDGYRLDENGVRH
ncbi:MAG: N-acetylmuramoyl-L-alanine amidase family protein [bacterium]|nr:N-acetylmuramoyl-L-alanine amidase family protein [bacterium]